MDKARSYKDLFVKGEGELHALAENIRTLTERQEARQRLQETLERIFGRSALLAMSEEDIAARLEAMPKRRCEHCIQPRPLVRGDYANQAVVLCNVCQRADAASGPEVRAAGTPVTDVR